MIANIAILYGSSRNSRSCLTRNYFYNTIKAGMCGLHELPTKPDMVCGTWVDDKVKKVKEMQGELF